MELQSKMVDTKQKLKMADLQIENLKRTITHSGISVFNTPSIIQIPLISFCIRFSIVSISGLTEHEIGTLPDETRVYESVGRMFILSDKPTVTTRLTEKQSTCQEKVIFNQLQYMLNILSEKLLYQDAPIEYILVQKYFVFASKIQKCAKQKRVHYIYQQNQKLCNTAFASKIKNVQNQKSNEWSLATLT